MEKFIGLVAEATDGDQSEISMEDPLADLDGWDSMAFVAFLILVDENYGKQLNSEQIGTAKTVRDLYGLAVG